MAVYNDARKVQDRLTSLERRMLAVETTSRAESASVGSGGINVYEGGAVNMLDGGELNIADKGKINVHGGSLRIRGTGTMTVDGNAAFNNTTRLSGDTTFGGTLGITSGSLILPTGSIENSALAEQLEVGYGRQTTSGFGLTTSTTTLITLTIPAPSWATRAAVMMNGFMLAIYTGVGNYGAMVSGVCAGSTSTDNTTTIGRNEAGRYGNIGRVIWSNSLSSVGSSITCTLRGRAFQNGEMSPHGNSWAELEAVAFFMR